MKIVTTMTGGLAIRSYTYEAFSGEMRGGKKKVLENFIKAIDKQETMLYIIDRKR